MTNKELARTFQFLANLMELHGENPYKIRSYQNAYLQLRKYPTPLAEMSREEREKIKGVGSAISTKIQELLETGKMETLERYKAQTPEGVQDMLDIKGFGPKKIQVIWQELGVESIGELLYAVNENRLIELKGFGAKTQEDLRQKLLYFQQSQHKFHFATLDAFSETVLAYLRDQLPAGSQVGICGALRRQENIVEAVEVLIALAEPQAVPALGGLSDAFPVILHYCTLADFGSEWFLRTGDTAFLDAFQQKFGPPKATPDEGAVFASAGLPFVPPALRNGDWMLERAAEGSVPALLQPADIQGVVHAHTTYSDGIHSIHEMAEAARDLGYRYLTITDHSKSAFYANGLKPERVWQQWEEIDRINAGYTDFQILKGIESDILNDGSLDYETDLLQGFDLIIASIHSNLRMDESKATARLITAVENPYTSILGHPTGRLLLSRKGYPIDPKKVIDACAANGVALELNANPYRLDLDWQWIPYALERGVMISINPDAHSVAGIRDIRFGVLSAQKGGLSAAECLNARGVDDFLAALRR